MDWPCDRYDQRIFLRSVQRTWDAHSLQPHGMRTFKRLHDPRFAAKLIDIVGLYVDPPFQAVVLSIDEKSQIQALNRTTLHCLPAGFAGETSGSYARIAAQAPVLRQDDA